MAFDQKDHERRMNDAKREEFIDDFKNGLRDELRNGFDKELGGSFEKLRQALSNLEDPLSCEQTAAVFQAAMEFDVGWKLMFESVVSLEELHQFHAHGPEKLNLFRHRMMMREIAELLSGDD